MQIRLDVRSLAIGLVIGAAVVAGFKATAQPTPASQANPPTNANANRYQITWAGAPKQVLALDQQTGKVYVITAAGPELWEATPGFSVPETVQLLEQRAKKPNEPR